MKSLIFSRTENPLSGFQEIRQFLLFPLGSSLFTHQEFFKELSTIKTATWWDFSLFPPNRKLRWSMWPMAPGRRSWDFRCTKQLRRLLGVVHTRRRLQQHPDVLSSWTCSEFNDERTGILPSRRSVRVLIRVHLSWTQATAWAMAFVPSD